MSFTMLYSKLHILTELNANDVKLYQLIYRKYILQKMYTYGTVNSIFVVIQPHSTNIENDPCKPLTSSVIRCIN